jgi:uncharacterized membrane protein YkvA (DUF1232 family)
MSQRAEHWALLVKRDVHATRDPRVPWYAKALAMCVAGYALYLQDGSAIALSRAKLSS